MLKEIKEHINKGKDTSFLLIGRQYCYHGYIFKIDLWSQSNSHKNLAVLLVKLEKPILKCIGEFKGLRITDTILKERNKMVDSHFMFSKYTTKLK